MLEEEAIVIDGYEYSCAYKGNIYKCAVPNPYWGYEPEQITLPEFAVILREQIAKEIENAIIEVVGNSASTMRQAAAIARGNND